MNPQPNDDHVELLFRKFLNGTLAKYTPLTTCEIKHVDLEKEMSVIRKMLWGVITLQLTLLGGIIVTLIR